MHLLKAGARPAFLYFIIEIIACLLCRGFKTDIKNNVRSNMTMTFAERADQLCDRLRDMEHHAEEGDQLFYCAYLLGLLGLHSSVEGEGQEEFDRAFTEILQETLEAEGVTDEDQDNIKALWVQVYSTVV